MSDAPTASSGLPLKFSTVFVLLVVAHDNANRRIYGAMDKTRENDTLYLGKAYKGYLTSLKGAFVLIISDVRIAPVSDAGKPFCRMLIEPKRGVFDSVRVAVLYMTETEKIEISKL